MDGGSGAIERMRDGFNDTGTMALVPAAGWAAGRREVPALLTAFRTPVGREAIEDVGAAGGLAGEKVASNFESEFQTRTTPE